MVDSALNDATLQPVTETIAEVDTDTDPGVDNATDPGTRTKNKSTHNPSLDDIAEKEDDSVESVTEPTRQTDESNTNDNEVRTELEVTESINNDTGNTETNEVSVDSQQASHDNDEPEQQTLIRRSKRIMNKPNPAIPPDDIGDNDDPKDIDFA